MCRYLERLLERQDYTRVSELLHDSASVQSLVAEELRISQSALRRLIWAMDVLSLLQSKLAKPCMTWSDLYIQAMSGELDKVLEDSLLLVMKLQSNLMLDLLEDLPRDIASDLAEVIADLNSLNTKAGFDEKTGFRSQYDIQHSDLRATVVAQKVELSRHTANISSEEATYTKIIDRVDTMLRSFFQTNIVNPQEDLFFQEIFVYDFKSSHRDVFTPRPRFAVERALSSPHDYLSCDCCNGAEGVLSATQPAIAILYQLYLESGSVINTADLWSAFWTIVGRQENEDEEVEEQKALSVFFATYHRN